MSDDFKVQWNVSLPPAAQYAKGDMLNVRGNTVAEVEELIDHILENDGEFLVKATNAATLLRGLGAANDGLGNTGASESSNSQSSSSDSGSFRTCEHGKRTRREGYGKKGKWVGHFCPLDKGDPNQCEPVWE